ncbi:hypothetical protein ScPMuIL_015412 [Solemya velum]
MSKTEQKDLFGVLMKNDDNHEFEMVPMKLGAPGPATLKGCSDLLKTATVQTLNEESEEQYIFQYGPRSGCPEFREELAKFLSVEYGNVVESNNLMVTAGATQGLHLISTVLFDVNTPVFVEDPTYFIAITMLQQDLGMNIISVPTDKDGILVDELGKLLEEHYPIDKNINQKSPFWAMVYLIPVFSNPKGYTLPPERCRKLVQLARKYDVLLLAEDVYNLITFSEEPPPPRLLQYDEKSDPEYKGNTLSNCTFSKILAPSLRLGWIEATDRVHQLLSMCHTAHSGGSFNHYMSKLMTVALKMGLVTNHLKRLRKVYKERMDLVYVELKSKLPSSVKVREPQGGFFLWLELPLSIDTEKLNELCTDKYRVNFLTGISASPTKSYRNCLRLSISYCTGEQLISGIERLANAIKEMLTSS